MEFRFGCGFAFMVDFSDLNDIRSFGRDLLGFFEGRGMGKEWLGVVLLCFRVEWIVSFVLILFGFVRRGVSNENG